MRQLAPGLPPDRTTRQAAAKGREALEGLIALHPLLCTAPLAQRRAQPLFIPRLRGEALGEAKSVITVLLAPHSAAPAGATTCCLEPSAKAQAAEPANGVQPRDARQAALGKARTGGALRAIPSGSPRIPWSQLLRGRPVASHKARVTTMTG